MDCSKPAAHPGTWCDSAPNNCTVQNGPCVWPIPAAPMSEGGQLPENIYVISCIKRIMRIIVKGTKNIFTHFFIEWLLPPKDLEPRSANHISTVLTARPRLQYRKPDNLTYTLHVINLSHFEEIINIIDIIDIISKIIYGTKSIWLHSEYDISVRRA